MKLLEATKENINHSVEVLKAGGLVAFPTETVYGLGADGLNDIAVSKIFEAKQRPSFNPLILHVSSIEMLNDIAEFSNEKILRLAEKFWPGPLTFILKKKDIVPYIVTSGLETVAVRMPDNKIALELINKLGKPIAAPSANSFSKLSPTKAEHVAKQLGDKVDVILNGGNCNVGVESTIIEVTNDSQILLRPGGVAKEEIEKLIGELSESKFNSDSPNSPGQLKIHYAPNIPIYFYDEEKLKLFVNKRIGGIFFNEVKDEKKFTDLKLLSAKGDLHEAAANLFSYLHDMENLDLDIILVEPIEKIGLGAAIMDRLSKAVNKFI
ncbi:MAG: threonylcarbamoyl-AMP synthase [Ignavibacteriales bacterium]|nr:threonylcarbamoyl-AMP synthase [Ignavibacteriales bacterium]MCB9258744.1 threonylcarbamoyl-AMP synthase [Ignavibacteriales bacterium]